MDLTSYLLGKKASGGGGGGGDLDWTAIGYTETPQNVVNTYNQINNDYNYSKNIFDNWDATQTDLSSKFNGDTNLVYMPLVDTSNATNTLGMFYNCNKLLEIPQLNTSNVENANTMFYGCSKITTIPQLDLQNCEKCGEMFRGCTELLNVPVLNLKKTTYIYGMFNSVRKLTNNSMDNILQSCTTIGSGYTGSKTLQTMGFGPTYYPAATIQSLPHYQDFIDAGWTIGY